MAPVYRITLLVTACASGVSAQNGRGSPGEIPGEPLFVAARRLFGDVGRGNDEYDLSGFNVPEYFRETEFIRENNHGWLFGVIRLMGVHLFPFRLFTGVVGRRASPPSELLCAWLLPVTFAAFRVSSKVPYRARNVQTRVRVELWNDHAS